jgi:hypothetical protein
MIDQSFPTITSIESATAPMERASFWQRLLAFLIDIMVVSHYRMYKFMACKLVAGW